jgi:hypothetical protein
MLLEFDSPFRLMKKIILFSFVALLFFGGVLVTEAAFPVNQSNYNSSSTFPGYGFFQSLGSGLLGDLNSIKIRYKHNEERVVLKFGSIDYVPFDCFAYQDYDSSYREIDLPTSTTGGEFLFNFDLATASPATGTVTLNPLKTYGITILGFNGGSILGGDSNPYTNGSSSINTAVTPHTCADTANNFDMYIKFTSGSSSGTATFGWPTEGVMTPYFTNWVIELNGVNPFPTQPYLLQVGYAPYSSSTSYAFNDYASVIPEASSTLFAFPKSTNLWDRPLLEGWDSKSWVAVVSLFSDITKTQLLSQQSIVFETTSRYSTSTVSSTPATIAAGVVGYQSPLAYTTDVDCSQYDAGSLFSTAVLPALGCFFQKGLVAAVDLIVLPHDAPKQYLTDSFGLFKNVFPFSVFFSLTDTVISQTASGTTVYSNDLRLDLPMLFNGDKIAIMNSSTLSGIIGQTNKNLVFDIEKYLFWLLAAFLCFQMIRHF